MFRYPRNHNEKKQNTNLEILNYVKPKRRYKNLIDDRDDLLQSNYGIKNWKRKKITKSWMKKFKK